MNNVARSPIVALKSDSDLQQASCVPASSCNPNAGCHPNCGVAPLEMNASYATRDAYFLHSLDFLWLELTSKCNLQCVHCYAESGPRSPLIQRMTYQDWFRVLEEAAALGCRKVQFIGGEPTFYPQLPELISQAGRLGYDFIEVFTNGTAFNAKIKQAFLAHKVNLAFSVYAATPSVHDSITVQSGSFSKTKKSIQWALEHGLTVRAAIIKMKENENEIEKTRRFLQDLGVTQIQLDSVRGVGRGSVDKTTDVQARELCGRCWEGKLCVTPTGEMFPCIFARSSLVGTVDDSVRTTVQGAALMKFRSHLRTQIHVERGSSCDPDICSPGCSPKCAPYDCAPDQPRCNPNGR